MSRRPYGNFGYAIIALVLTSCGNTTISPFSAQGTSDPSGPDAAPANSGPPPVPTMDASAPTSERDAASNSPLVDAGPSGDAGGDADIPDSSNDGGRWPNCGNGRADPGEACDDGNPLEADGCSDQCSIESGHLCGPPPGENLVISGDFGSLMAQDFTTDYQLLPDDATELLVGACSTRPNPDRDPQLHVDFLDPSSQSWRDVDPSADNRSLMCNGSAELTIWKQTVELPVGRFTFSYWSREWGLISRSVLQVYVDHETVAAPFMPLEGHWRRRTFAVTIETAGAHDFELRDLSSADEGNNFAIDRIELFSEQPDVCFEP